MKIEKLVFTNEEWHIINNETSLKNSADLVFIFGDIDLLEKYDHYKLLQDRYPKAQILICSTAGNILDTSIDAYEAVGTAVSFDSAYVHAYAEQIDKKAAANDIKLLLDMVQKEDLQHLFFFAPGLFNASEIIESIILQENISISGGFAGDTKFDHTYLQLNEKGGEDIVVFIGLYGSSLHIEISSETGLHEFGSQRVITKSHKNIVYEIDNKPAIELYKRYLGKKAKDLPVSALRFPLNVHNGHKNDKTICTVMKINEDHSLVFAGNIHEGATVKLMKTNVHNILDSAFLAAKKIRPFNAKPSLTLTISCSIRRSVLKQFSEKEIEIIQDILGSNTQIVGFYSYGEIAKFRQEKRQSPLRNQTLTITTIYEE